MLKEKVFMANIIKKYKVGLDSETYAVSLVDAPAIEEDFVFLSSDDKRTKIVMSTDDRHLVFGPVLIPDLNIYRYNDETNEEYYVSFSKEVIDKMSKDFMVNYRQHNITLDHESEASEVCIIESWLKEDSKLDKSVALGLSESLPVGTWFVGMKINNIDTWARIKNGELRGFSVESLISLEDFSKQEPVLSDVNGNIEKALNFEDVEAPQEQPENDPIEAPETPQNAEVVEQPIEKKIEPVEEPQGEPATPQPEPATEPTPEPQEEPKPKSPLEELVRNLQAELDALKKTNSDLVEKVKSLSTMPSAKPVSTVAGGNTGGDNYSAWRETMAKYL